MLVDSANCNARQDEEVVPPSSNESLHKRMIASLHDIHMRDGTVVAKHACRTSFAPLALQSKKIRYFFFIVHVKILQCVCTFDHEMPMMSQVASLPLKFIVDLGVDDRSTGLLE